MYWVKSKLLRAFSQYWILSLQLERWDTKVDFYFRTGRRSCVINTKVTAFKCGKRYKLLQYENVFVHVSVCFGTGQWPVSKNISSFRGSYVVLNFKSHSHPGCSSTLLWREALILKATGTRCPSDCGSSLADAQVEAQIFGPSSESAHAKRDRLRPPERFQILIWHLAGKLRFLRCLFKATDR